MGVGGGATAHFLLPDKLELLDPTLRGLHRFMPRHKDEIEIDIGDPVYVQREAEDLWCEGEASYRETFLYLVSSRRPFRGLQILFSI